MGLQARLMSQALRKLTANIKKSTTYDIYKSNPNEDRGVMFSSRDNNWW